MRKGCLHRYIKFESKTLDKVTIIWPCSFKPISVFKVHRLSKDFFFCSSTNLGSVRAKRASATTSCKKYLKQYLIWLN